MSCPCQKSLVKTSNKLFKSRYRITYHRRCVPGLPGMMASLDNDCNDDPDSGLDIAELCPGFVCLHGVSFQQQIYPN